MNQKLVTVAHFDDYIAADLARQRLEDEGLKAFVMGQNVGNVYGGLPAAVDIELQTPEDQAQQAREILEAHRQQESGQDEELDEESDFADDEDFDEGQEEQE
jgi:hypothetical protein